MVISLLGLAVLAAVLVTPSSGVLSPRLNAEWRGYCDREPCQRAGSEFWFIFELRNDGRVGAEILDVNGSADGLGTPTMFVRPDLVDRLDEGPRGQFPVHLDPGASVFVYVIYDQLVCDELDPDPKLVLPIQAKGPLKIPLFVGVIPGLFMPGYSGHREFEVGNDPSGISWSSGLTWDACHPR